MDQTYTYPQDRYYDQANYLWYKPEAGGVLRVGITESGLKEVGRVIAVMPRPVGRRIEPDKGFATLESGKWVGSARLPFAAEIVESHEDLIDDCSPINNDPYGEGWLVAVLPQDLAAALSILINEARA